MGSSEENLAIIKLIQPIVATFAGLGTGLVAVLGLGVALQPLS